MSFRECSIPFGFTCETFFVLYKVVHRYPDVEYSIFIGNQVERIGQARPEKTYFPPPFWFPWVRIEDRLWQFLSYTEIEEHSVRHLCGGRHAQQVKSGKGGL